MENHPESAPRRRFYRHVPGLRTGRWWKALIAAAFYLFCALGILVGAGAHSLGVTAFYVGLLVLGVVPVALWPIVKDGFVDGRLPTRAERLEIRARREQEAGRRLADRAAANAERQQARAARRQVKDAERVRRSEVASIRADVKRAEKDQGGRVKDAERSVQAAVKARESAIATAQRGLEAAQREQQKAQSGALARLASWQPSQLGRKVGAYKGVTLYEYGIKTPAGTCSLSGGSATVDTAGNLAVTKRVTLTRVVVGGVIGGLLFQKKQTHDSRELYLLIETEQFADVVQCDPEDGPKVRRLAAAINTRARQASLRDEQRPAAVASLTKEVAAINADVAAINAAQAEVSRVESDPALLEAITVAQNEVVAAKTDRTEVERHLNRLPQEGDEVNRP